MTPLQNRNKHGGCIQSQSTIVLSNARTHTSSRFLVTWSRGPTEEFIMFTHFSLNDGGSVPTIAFGTGTTFKNRSDDAAVAVLKGIRAGFRVRKISSNRNESETTG